MNGDGFTENALIGTLLFFVINVIVNLYLMNKVFDERKKNRLLQRQTLNPIEIVKQHLNNEHKKTKTLNLSTYQLDKRAFSVRLGYTKIESQALNKELDSEDYWQFLNENLMRLLKITFPSEHQKNTEKAELNKQIDRLKNRIETLPAPNKKGGLKRHAIEAISQYHERLNSSKLPLADTQKKLDKLKQIMDLFENPEKRKKYISAKIKNSYAKKSQKHLSAIHSNQKRNASNIESFEAEIAPQNKTQQLMREVERFKNENKSLQEHIAGLQKDLHKISIALPDNQTPEAFITDDITEADDDGDRISDELLDANEKEIDRLRDVVSNQRKSILEMERSLRELEQSAPSNNEEQQSQIEKMKRCIQESETCITMLEKEIDLLKSNLAELRQSKDSTMNDLELEHLNEELINTQKELQHQSSKQTQYDALFNFLNEVMAATSIEDISLLIYESITTLNYQPHILLKSADRTLIISKSGDISVRDKVLINNMMPNEVNPGRSGQISFRFRNLAGIIRPNDLSGDGSENDQEYLLQLLRLTDQITQLAVKAHKSVTTTKIRDSAIDGVKKTSLNIDQLVDDQANRIQKLVKGNFEHILDVARVKGLNASMIASISQIEQETLKQMANESTLKLKLRRQIVGLLNELEELK